MSYNGVKDNNGRAGKRRKTCKFILVLDAILGTRAVTMTTQVLENSTELSEVLSDEVVQERDEFASTDDEAEEHTDDTVVWKDGLYQGQRPERQLLASSSSSSSASSFDNRRKRQGYPARE